MSTLISPRPPPPRPCKNRADPSFACYFDLPVELRLQLFQTIFQPAVNLVTQYAVRYLSPDTDPTIHYLLSTNPQLRDEAFAYIEEMISVPLLAPNWRGAATGPPLAAIPIPNPKPEKLGEEHEEYRDWGTVSRFGRSSGW